MYDERVDDFLAHHGIQGMKWGVSNGPPYPLSDAEHKRVIDKAKDAAKVTGHAVKKVGSGAVKVAKKIKANHREKEIRNLDKEAFNKKKGKYSDEEVARIANRLRMEQQIADLGKNTTNKGSDFVSSTLGKVAGDAFKDVATATATTVVERALGVKDKSTGSMIQEEFSKIRKSTRSGGKKDSGGNLEDTIRQIVREEKDKD